MNSSQPVQDRMRIAFAPTRRGVAGLADQLVTACVGGDIEFERVGDRCVCRWTMNGDTQEAVAPLAPAAFRTLLARIAFLCNERKPGSVTPYGGDGLLAVEGRVATDIRVVFVNTPDQQRLELRSSGAAALPTPAVAEAKTAESLAPEHAGWSSAQEC